MPGADACKFNLQGMREIWDQVGSRPEATMQMRIRLGFNSFLDVIISRCVGSFLGAMPCGSIGLPRCTARPTHHQAPASARRRRCAGGAVALLMQACSRPAASAPAIMPSPKGTSRRHADEPGTSQQVTRPSDMHACTHTHAPGPSTTSAALLPAFLLPEYWVPKLSFRLEP